jgi:hypothetical protein
MWDQLSEQELKQVKSIEQPTIDLIWQMLEPEGIAIFAAARNTFLSL